MKRIDNLEQLKAEKKRLKLRAQTLEGNIRNDWETVKYKLAPVNLVINSFSKSLSRDKQNFVGETLNIGIDLLLRKVLLRNRGILVKWIVPYLVKNLTGNYIKDHRVDVMSWLRNKLGSVFKKNGHDKYYDQSTADINSTTW